MLDSHVLLRAFCEELARCGMRHAATSPGSRCTPILLALAREPAVRAWSHIDERSAGFFALGAAKVAGVPAAVTCTSGTAAANLAPAVIEAYQAAVPMIVLTADRPPELRDVGAGQTIDQVKLYGDAVKWFAEPDLDAATPARVRMIRALACRVFWTATTGRPGPVHVNLPLREPLVAAGPLPADPAPGRPGGLPWITDLRPAGGSLTLADLRLGRAVLVAGTGVPRAAAERLAGLAERARLPLLADPLSGARRGAAAIARYDHLLRDPELAARLRPETVLRFGDLPTSKPLRSWLAEMPEARQVSLAEHDAWQDPDATVSVRVTGPALAALAALEGPTGQEGWLEQWQAADRRAEEAIAEVLAGEPPLSEPAVAAALGAALPAQATLLVAASMPVRDLESFFPVRADQPRVIANRGANGIDGTVSTAYGVAAAGGGPVVLLIGDVALAHDIGGLLTGRRHGIPLTIVVVNNDGGGIFHFLPIAKERDAFEEHVATPHALDFATAASLYGAGHELIADEPGLHAALRRSLGAAGTQLIEVRTDRAANLDLHRRIAQAVTSSSP